MGHRGLGGVMGLVSLASVVWIAGCGDSSGSVAGCGSDVDCKGDRICVAGQCMDPGGADSGTSGGTGATGSGATGGSGGNGMTSTGSADAGPSGSGSDAGVGTSSSGIGVDNPALEDACIADCHAKLDAACEMGFTSLDQCVAQCIVIDEVSDSYCHDEQKAQYECLAAGGYTCLNGYPQPKSTCIVESQALSTCNQELPCRRFCDAAGGTSCGPEKATCFDDCRTEEQGFEDIVCSFDYSRLLTCWGDNFACNGSLRSVEGCGAEASEVADCIGLRQSECEGFCWAADLLGCGSADCVDTCQAKVDDVACGYLYRRLVECAWDSNSELYLTCEGGEPTLTADCDSDAQAYTDCVTP